jgi:hypothetical protein
MDLDELIISLNRSLAGWANYFRHGVSKAMFGAVDFHAWKVASTEVVYGGPDVGRVVK